MLAQSYIDRIEKAGPVALIESRTPEEARLIISKRLQHADGSGTSSPTRRLFRPAVLRGVRRPFDAAPPRAAQARLREQDGVRPSRARADPGEAVRLHLDAGGGAGLRRRRHDQTPTDSGRRSTSASCGSASPTQSEAEIPSDDQELLDVLTGALCAGARGMGPHHRAHRASASSSARSCPPST